MKLLLFDQNLSPRLVDRLADLYPGSIHVSTVGLSTAFDKVVWGYARQHDYIIVTKDADFSELGLLLGFPPPSDLDTPRKLLNTRDGDVAPRQLRCDYRPKRK